MSRCAVVVTFLACWVAGCAWTPRNAGLDATLKQFVTKPEVAGLYVYCDQWMGLVPKSNVLVDGQPLGQLGSHAYLYADVSPGRHSITAMMDDTDTLEVDAVPGRNYYVWQEPKLGWGYPRARLHLVPEARGQAAVHSARVAESTYREEDQRKLKAQTVLSGILVHVLGALPFAGGGAAIGVGTFLH